MAGNHFKRDDCKLQGDPLHYTACGLDDVYLLNGFTVEHTAYGDGYAINDIENLHRAIGKHIILQKSMISAKEFKFLRKEMEHTQEELARLLGVSAQQVARYEKDSVTEMADRLIRVMYVFHLVPAEHRNDIMASFLETLRDPSDESQDMPAHFVNAEHAWLEKAA